MSNTNEKIHKTKIINTTSYMAIPGLKLDGYKFIIDLVCKEFHVNKNEVFNRSRKREFVFARQVMMFIADFTFKYETLSEIGKAFGGYDHATVIHSKRAINDILFYDKYLHKKIMHVLEETTAIKGRFIQETNGRKKATLIA